MRYGDYAASTGEQWRSFRRDVVPSDSESRSPRRIALESFERAMYLQQDSCENLKSRRWWVFRFAVLSGVMVCSPVRVYRCSVGFCCQPRQVITWRWRRVINPLNADLNPISHLIALVGARHIVHVSRIRVKSHPPFASIGRSPPYCPR